MGETTARKVDQTQTFNIRTTPQNRPINRTALTLHIGNSTSSLRAETTPRGYKAQHIHKKDGKRYRFRILIQFFPRRGTIGGKLTIITLGENTITTNELPEQPTTYPDLPFTHDWQNLTADLGGTTPLRITITTA